MRKSDLFLSLLSVSALFFIFLILIHSNMVREDSSRREISKRKLVKELMLTDLCLFPEARYTRHLSQADLHSPFQDHPMSLEHFPSGALTSPPAHLLNAPAWKAGPRHDQEKNEK